MLPYRDLNDTGRSSSSVPPLAMTMLCVDWTCAQLFFFINQSADHVCAEPKIVIRTDHGSMMIRCTTITQGFDRTVSVTAEVTRSFVPFLIICRSYQVCLQAFLITCNLHNCFILYYIMYFNTVIKWNHIMLKGGITHTVSPNLMLILSTFRVVLHPSYLQKSLVLSYL